MRQYELMIILDPDLEERTISPSLDKFLSVVTKDKGTVDNVARWIRNTPTDAGRIDGFLRFGKWRECNYAD